MGEQVCSLHEFNFEHNEFELSVEISGWEVKKAFGKILM